MTKLPRHPAARAGHARLALIAGVATALFVMGQPASAQRFDDPEDRDDRGRATQASGEVDADTFGEQLERYGRWFDHPRWGHVWAPEVDEGWRPYTRGHWEQTEEHGWYWVSEEPFGWAVYHYGRWTFDEDDGWIWIPGRTWAPAWVSWRQSDDYIGWAPLPPEAEWMPDRGLGYVSPSHYDGALGSLFWVFARPRHMTEPGLWRNIAPRSRAPTLIRETRFVHGFVPGERRLYHRGIDVRLVERSIGRPIVPVRLRPVENVREHGLRGGGDRRGVREIPVFRPRITATNIRPAEPSRPGVSILQPRANPGGRPDGWRPGAERPRDGRGLPAYPAARPQVLPRPDAGRDNRPITAPRPTPDLRRPDLRNSDPRGADPGNSGQRPQVLPRPDNRPAPQPSPPPQPQVRQTLPPPAPPPFVRQAPPPPAPPPVVRQVQPPAPPPVAQQPRPQTQPPQGQPPGQRQGQGQGGRPPRKDGDPPPQPPR